MATRPEIAKAVFFLRQLALVEDGGVHGVEILALAEKINSLQRLVPLDEEPADQDLLGEVCDHCWIDAAVCLVGVEADMGLCCEGCTHAASLFEFYTDPLNQEPQGPPVRRRKRHE